MMSKSLNKTGPRYLLAIETAVGHGSIALMDGAAVIAQSDGSAAVRAEELVASVESLTKRAGVGRRDLGLIAVSKGPGSFTGIRIGLAFAKGLAAAVGAEIRTVSLLQALAMAGNEGGGAVWAAVRTGRREVCVQAFTDGLEPVAAPRILRPEDIQAEIGRILEQGSRVVLEEGAGELLTNPADRGAVTVVAGAALAGWIGRAALRASGNSGGELIYLNTRFELPESGGRA